MPGRHGEKVVIRIIDSRATLVPLERLGMSASILQHWNGVIARPNGIALVTGPTGSGKSTTLYSVLASLNGTERNISTVEDPIEATLAGVNGRAEPVPGGHVGPDLRPREDPRDRPQRRERR